MRNHLKTIGLMAILATSLGAQPALKAVYEKDFLIGVAVNQRQFAGQDARGGPIIIANFNSISPENVLKWDSIHPRLDGYAFAGPDQYVAFGETNRMLIVGHTL